MRLSLRKGKAAAARAAAIVVLIILVAVVAVVAWFVRSPLPIVDGTLTVTGIHAPVTIRRDTRGIPHIEASAEADLFFGEGFACAQDRLWQMDLLRRTAQGELSQVVGPAALEIDRYMRTIGLGNAAEHDAAALNVSERRDAEAYAAGVNAVMSTHPLPLEFRLLGYRPQPWTPTDSIAIIKLMAQRLDDQWDLVELRALLQRKIGAAAANDLMDSQTPWLEHYIAGKRVARGFAPKAVLSRGLALAGIGSLRGFPPLPPDPQNGSNNWVIAGKLVTTGKPVLSNDTHLGHSVPSTYWLVHLEGAGFNVEGFTIPGVPGIALGHNARVGFGVTSGAAAVQDVFVERFRSRTSDEYRANGRWVRAAHRLERIEIKRGAPEVVDVLVTRHGPVIKRFGNSAYSLAWTILRRGDELELIRLLDLAKNWNDFEGALSKVVGPVFNWVYADVDGNIGYHLAGWVPNREHGDGSLPVEGENDRYDWHGYIAFDRLPHAFNPGSGFLATANNQLAPPDTQIGSSPFFDYPYRIDEINNRISAGTKGGAKMSPQTIGSIQADVRDFARVLQNADIARILRESPDRRLGKIAAQLSRWGGEVTADSTVPTFLAAEERALEDQLLLPRIGPLLLERYRKNFKSVVPFGRALGNEPPLYSIGLTRNAMLAAIPRACSRAADILRANVKDGLNRIAPWGMQNKAIFDHPLARMWPLDVMLSIGQFPQPGDGFSVYATKPDHGPASRLVDDFSNWDNSSMVLTLGESGQFNSPHYQDEVDDFRDVRWVPTPFSDAAVKAATKDTLVLNP
jgi:penicillin amidase